MTPKEVAADEISKLKMDLIAAKVRSERLPRAEIPDICRGRGSGTFASGFEVGFRGWEYDDDLYTHPYYHAAFRLGYLAGVVAARDIAIKRISEARTAEAQGRRG